MDQLARTPPADLPLSHAALRCDMSAPLGMMPSPLQLSTGLHPVVVAAEVELQQGREMVGGLTRDLGNHTLEARVPRSSSSVNTSTTRTGLFSVTQSLWQGGRSVTGRRSAPLTKRFIPISRTLGFQSSESARFYTVCNPSCRTEGFGKGIDDLLEVELLPQARHTLGPGR